MTTPTTAATTTMTTTTTTTTTTLLWEANIVDSKFSIHCRIRGSVPVKLLSEAMYYMQHINLVNLIPKAQSIKFDRALQTS